MNTNAVSVEQPDIVMSTVRDRRLRSSIMPVLTIACRSSWLAMTALAVVALTTACSSDDDGVASSEREAVPASDLAASQVVASTVAPPALVELCDPAELGVVSLEGDGEPDQVIELTNEGTRQCDVDIGATPDAADDMEPSVRLAPGEVGFVWVVDAGGCDRSLADPQTEMELDINRERVRLDVEFTAACGVDVVAFFTG